MTSIPVGAVRLEHVSRRFKLVHERNLTLKEAVLRRQRTRHTEFWALRDISLDIAPGEAVALVGRNGSGKSTALKIIAGIIPPHEGTVESRGRVASLLELGAGFHPDFSGRENVFMNGAIYGFTEREVAQRMDEIVGFAELEEFIDMPVRSYSSGMFMRLAFSVAIHVDADILLLDEVMAVGDEAFQRKCFGRIFAFQRKGGTIVFVSHDAAAVERVCTRALLLDGGRCVADGPPADTLNAYHRLLADSGEETSGVEPGQQGHWGSGRVTIEAAELVGESGPTFRVMSGDAVELHLTVLARHGAVENPCYGFGVFDLDGHCYFGTNTALEGVETPTVDGYSSVRIRIHDLPLHEGHFSLQTAIVAADQSEVYHWIDRVFEFDVFPRNQGTGVVRMTHEWSFDEGAAHTAVAGGADGSGAGST